MKTILLLHLTIAVVINLCTAQIDLSNVEIPDIDDIEAIKERCDSKGGEGTYEKVKTAKDNLQTCLQGLVDFNTLKNEVEESKKTGSMDEVFGKYCNKRPKARACVTNFTDAITPCLEDSEKEALNITLDILKQLGEFVCYRDGDRIAMFIAEGGVECIKSHTEGIKNCVNSTLKINPTSTTAAFPSLLIDKKKCDDLSKLQTCVVEELEKCKDSTPANIVDALFRFVKRSACTDRKTRSLHNHFKRHADLFSMVHSKPEQLESLMKTKCDQNAAEGGYQHLIESLHNWRFCGVQRLNQTPRELKSRIQNCTEDFVKALQDCLPSSEKKYPQFAMDVIYAMIDFIEDNNKTLAALYQNYEMRICFQNLQTSSSKQGLLNCLLSKTEELNTNDIFNITITCERMITAQDCISKQIDVGCPKDVEINKLKNNFFAAMHRPCNRTEIETS